MRHGVRPRWPPASGYGLLVEIEDFEIEISSGDEGFGFELSIIRGQGQGWGPLSLARLSRY